MQHENEGALAAAILETVRLPLLALAADLRVETANDAFLRHFRTTAADTVGRLVYDLGNGQWDIPELRRLLGEILPERRTVSDYRVEHGFERIGRRVMHVSARRIARGAAPDLILLAISDDTEREALRTELVRRIELADKLIDSVREGLLILDPDLRVHSASASFYETFAVDPAETIGHLVYELGNGQWDIPGLRQLLEDVLPKLRSFDDYEFTHAFEGIGERVMVLNGRRLDHQDLILLAIRDVTDTRESAARLKEVARAAHIGVFENDRRTGVLYWSPELCDIVGHPRDEPPPPPGVVPDFVHPEDRPAVEAMIGDATDPRGDGAIFHEHRIVRPDGAVRWVQLHGRTEFDGGGGERRPVRLRGVLLDVTDRKAAQEALRESKERQTFLLELSDSLKASAEASEVAGIATRLVGERLKATRACYVTWPPGEAHAEVSSDYALPGAPSLAGRYPVDAFRSARENLSRGKAWIVEDAAAADGLGEAERDHPLGRGMAAWVDIPLVKDGVLQAALCVVQDEPRAWKAEEVALIEEVADRCWAAVERTRAEAALRASEERYRSLFESIDEGFCVTEFRFDASDGRADYRVVEANPAFFGQTGFPERILGQWLREAAPELEEHWYEIYGEVARTREPRRFEQWSDMLGRWFDVYAFPIGDPRQLRVAILFRDVTGRKRAEDHRTMLMAELDHRVKNILAVVQSIARQTLGRGRHAGPEAADRLIGRINALAQSHTLLARSRWEGAGFAELVESAVAPYRGARPDRVLTEGPDLKVTPEAAQTLTLALHELVTNAAKYGALSREDGRVLAEWHLSGEGEGRRLVFVWQEEGGPPLEAPPERKGFGSALIERTLAFELDGEVTLHFAREGLRALFDLPLGKLRVAGERSDPARRRGEAPPPADLATLRDKRILLVEDEHLVGQEAAQALRSAGCAVTGPVATCAEALRIAVADDLDAAVLDINLGGDVVWPTARALWARGIPLVFATGYSDTIETPPELADAPRIEKPVRPERLVAALASVAAAA